MLRFKLSIILTVSFLKLVHPRVIHSAQGFSLTEEYVNFNDGQSVNNRSVYNITYSRDGVSMFAEISKLDGRIGGVSLWSTARHEARLVSLMTSAKAFSHGLILAPFVNRIPNGAYDLPDGSHYLLEDLLIDDQSNCPPPGRTDCNCYLPFYNAVNGFFDSANGRVHLESTKYKFEALEGMATLTLSYSFSGRETPGYPFKPDMQIEYRMLPPDTFEVLITATAPQDATSWIPFCSGIHWYVPVSNLNESWVHFVGDSKQIETTCNLQPVGESQTESDRVVPLKEWLDTEYHMTDGSNSQIYVVDPEYYPEVVSMEGAPWAQLYNRAAKWENHLGQPQAVAVEPMSCENNGFNYPWNGSPLLLPGSTSTSTFRLRLADASSTDTTRLAAWIATFMVSRFQAYVWPLCFMVILVGAVIVALRHAAVHFMPKPEHLAQALISK